MVGSVESFVHERSLAQLEASYSNVKMLHYLLLANTHTYAVYKDFHFKISHTFMIFN